MAHEVPIVSLDTACLSSPSCHEQDSSVLKHPGDMDRGVLLMQPTWLLSTVPGVGRPPETPLSSCYEFSRPGTDRAHLLLTHWPGWSSRGQDIPSLHRGRGCLRPIASVCPLWAGR